MPGLRQHRSDIVASILCQFCADNITLQPATRDVPAAAETYAVVNFFVFKKYQSTANFESNFLLCSAIFKFIRYRGASRQGKREAIKL
jgi:hypothetical protein